jgi:hypothetical protein
MNDTDNFFQITRKAAAFTLREYFRPLIILFQCITWLFARQPGATISPEGGSASQEKPTESIKGP